MKRRLLRGAVPVVLGALAAGAAWGFWTDGVAEGSKGEAPIASVQPLAAPTASATASTAAVSWSAGTLTDGTAVTGYVVSRRNEGSGVVVAAGNGCGGTLTTTTCTETGVPGGTWSYAITPRFATSWTGPTSPWSEPVTVDVTGPTGGSVTATGLTGTGSRWSRTLTLSLSLSAGTDPSGIAASGAQLLRSDAPVSASGTTEGTCGTWTAYSALATDPVTPYTDTVPATGRCYRYQYVVADSRGNATTYTSQDVKVDTTAPATPSLSPAALSGSMVSGSTVYYRPSAGGSFRVTSSASDPQSGIASTTFPTLGAGWTRTGTNPATYTWTAGATAPGSASVTVANHAGAASAPSSFTVVADNAAPSGGSIGYSDGDTTADHVTVSIAAGTDTGSGIVTRQLQRATATLAGGTCGTFSAYGPAVHATSTGTSVSEPITPGTCYTFRYVVTDGVGNVQTYTSSSVVRATVSGYAAAVRATAGLTSFWRLGERHLAADSFTGTAGSTVQSRSGESTAWTRFVYSTTDAVLTTAGRVRRVGATSGTTQGVALYSQVEPDTADYSVGADLYVASLIPNDAVALMGRFSLDNFASAYAGGYDAAAGTWGIQRVVGGTRTVLATSAVQPLTVGRTYRVELQMQGSTVTLYVDGAPVASYVDGPATVLTTRGEGGIALGWGTSPSAAPTDTTGFQLDNFRITNLLRDSVGSASGVHVGTPVLGQASAVAGDQDMSMETTGTSRGVTTANLGSNLTVELWFRTSQGAGGGSTWADGARLVEAAVGGASTAGISVTSDGHLVAGATGMASPVLSATGGYADGQWHHVVFVRSATSDLATLYVDGAPVGSAAGVGTPVTGQAMLTFGTAVDGTLGFTGRLDEIALYGATALDAATVTAHWASR